MMDERTKDRWQMADPWRWLHTADSSVSLRVIVDIDGQQREEEERKHQ